MQFIFVILIYFVNTIDIDYIIILNFAIYFIVFYLFCIILLQSKYISFIISLGG
nr:MAG TPA: hypothetical protein [Caudoviricetes sp.]